MNPSLLRYVTASFLLACPTFAQQIVVSTSPGTIQLSQSCSSFNPKCDSSSKGTITLTGKAVSGKTFTAKTYVIPGPGLSPKDNWLRISSPSHPTPSTMISENISNTVTLTVTTDPTVLLNRSATYFGYVSISAPGVSVSPSLIPVSLANSWFPQSAADSPAPQFVGLGDSYNFPPSGGSLDITLKFPSGLDPSQYLAPTPYYASRIEAGDGLSSWLTVAPSISSTQSNKVRVTTNTAGLTGGQQYYAFVVIQNSDANGNSTSDNKAVLAVFITAPVTTVSFNVAQSALDFSVAAGSPGMVTKPLNVTYSATGSVSGFTAAAQSDVGSGWLSISPLSGSADTALTVAIDPSHLPVGKSTGRVTITAPGALNSPVVVPVTVQAVLPPVITGIVPATLTSSASSQRLLVQGLNFLAGLTITLGFPDGGTRSLSGQQLDSLVASSCGLTTTISTPGSYSLQLKNPDGGVSNIFKFSVTGPSLASPPVIYSNGVVLNPTNPGVATISPGSWVSVYGDNLAPNDPDGKDWSGLILNGKFPTNIDGVSVTVNGRLAAIAYIKKGLINLQAPDDNATGRVNVVVTTPNGSSAPMPVNLQTYSPALFAFGGKYAIAQIYPDNALAAPVNYVSGVTTRPAKPGEIVTLYGTGFGPTKTLAPAGLTVEMPVELSSGVTATVGGVSAKVLYAGLTAAGLNQLQLVVPNVAPGDQLLLLNVSGVSILSTLYLNVGN